MAPSGPGHPHRGRSIRWGWLESIKRWPQALGTVPGLLAATAGGLLLGSLGLAPAQETEDQELHIYCWTAYVPESVIEKFSEETGIRVFLENYSSNDELLRRRLAGGRHDLIQPSDYAVESLIQAGLLEPLNRQRFPNLRNIDPEFARLPHDPEGGRRNSLVSMNHEYFPMFEPYSHSHTNLWTRCRSLRFHSPGIDPRRGVAGMAAEGGIARLLHAPGHEGVPANHLRRPAAHSRRTPSGEASLCPMDRTGSAGARLRRLAVLPSSRRRALREQRSPGDRAARGSRPRHHPRCTGYTGCSGCSGRSPGPFD